MSEVNDSPALDVAEPLDIDAIEAEGLDAVEGDEEGSAEAPEAEAAKIDAAQKAGEISKKEAQALKKKLTIKVDGQELEEEVDFNDEENLKKHLQKSKAFDKRLKEFSGYKSQVEQMLEMLKNAPEEVLEKMGINVDELAEKRLSRKVDELKKSPEQIERERMEKELEDLRKEKKAAKEAQEKAELEKMRNEAAQQIETDISEALSSANSVLPKNNPLVLQRIAQTMLMAMKNGYPQVTAKDVLPLVEKQWKQELNDLFAMSSEEALEALVGKPALDKYRKSRIAAAKQKKTTTAKQAVTDTAPKKSEEKKEDQPKLRMKDVFNFRT